MANNQKKYASLTTLQNFLDNLKGTFALLSHKHTIADLTDYTVDTSLSSTSINPVQNKVIDAEFDAIGDAMGALELAIDGKADSSHSHDDAYYTETEIDAKLASKADVAHNHDSDYDEKGAANTAADAALESAKSYTDTKTTGLASTTYVDTSVTNIPAITIEEIDEICGASIYAASEVKV